MPSAARFHLTKSEQLPSFPPSDSVPIDTDVVVVIAALLCAVVSVAGLALVARCACLRRSPALPANSGIEKEALQVDAATGSTSGASTRGSTPTRAARPAAGCSSSPHHRPGDGVQYELRRRAAEREDGDENRFLSLRNMIRRESSTSRNLESHPHVWPCWGVCMARAQWQVDRGLTGEEALTSWSDLGWSERSLTSSSLPPPPNFFVVPQSSIYRSERRWRPNSIRVAGVCGKQLTGGSGCDDWDDEDAGGNIVGGERLQRALRVSALTCDKDCSYGVQVAA
ncbi:hypothetical protein BHE74_00026107 [Ensete ventricosum]|nr:hypothetical protein GW17_00010235 [Ensete ventricosum]RWW66520.1 hypothetical protein BHE74_00026107 [Ensete ventricosum]RZS17321.1 hypothetical protein BHM03_00049451 [Ensete ventricosum]